MLEVNINERYVHDLILESLKNKKPLSVIRIGDGEISTLKYDLDRNLTNRFYQRHTGKQPTESEMIEISNNLRSSILDADIIGISPKGIEERSTNPVWGLTNSILYDLIQENHDSKKYCDMNLHYKLNKHGLLDNILKSIDELYILTPRDVVSQLQKKYPNIKKVHFIKIPGQYIFEESPVIEGYYPETYNKIISDFKNQKFDGKLLLFGGGFIGKNLGVEFSRMGGVSLDIGSVFDMFVGKVTRGKGKGPNVYVKPILE
jgi:hypothetical protein